jgi:hypothetical protein
MQRIYHHWEKWECVKAGFYETLPPNGLSADEAREAYRAFLADTPRFIAAMHKVLERWPHSCEQFLTNTQINRIAWMGQAAMCIETGVPSSFRGGFKLLSPSQQREANKNAQLMIELWQKNKLKEINEKDRAILEHMEEPRLF